MTAPQILRGAAYKLKSLFQEQIQHSPTARIRGLHHTIDDFLLELCGLPLFLQISRSNTPNLEILNHFEQKLGIDFSCNRKEWISFGVQIWMH